MCYKREVEIEGSGCCSEYEVDIVLRADQKKEEELSNEPEEAGEVAELVKSEGMRLV